MRIEQIDAKIATKIVVENHYLHRRPPITFAYGLLDCQKIIGVVTFGTPASRHLQKSACNCNPNLVIELNRLWIDDAAPANTASYFVSKVLKVLPPRIIVSYADTKHDHYGYVYRAMNFFYAGWTDMERKTPRFDYIPSRAGIHTRDAFRNGYVEKKRRTPKVKYWTVTGNKRERKKLKALCTWPSLCWKTLPPP